MQKGTSDTAMKSVGEGRGGTKNRPGRAARLGEEAGGGQYLPVEADGASLLGLHPVMFQQQAHHLGVAIAGCDDQGRGALPSLLADIAQQIADVAFGPVEEQGG